MALTGAEKAKLWRDRQRGEIPAAAYSSCSSCGKKRKVARCNPLHGDLCVECFRSSPAGKTSERKRILAVARRRAAIEYAKRIEAAAALLQSTAVKRLILAGNANGKEFYVMLDEIALKAKTELAALALLD